MIEPQVDLTQSPTSVHTIQWSGGWGVLAVLSATTPHGYAEIEYRQQYWQIPSPGSPTGVSHLWLPNYRLTVNQAPFEHTDRQFLIKLAQGYFSHFAAYFEPELVRSFLADMAKEQSALVSGPSQSPAAPAE